MLEVRSRKRNKKQRLYPPSSLLWHISDEIAAPMTKTRGIINNYNLDLTSVIHKCEKCAKSFIKEYTLKEVDSCHNWICPECVKDTVHQSEADKNNENIVDLTESGDEGHTSVKCDNNEASGSKATGCKQCENSSLKVKHTCDRANKAPASKFTPEKKKETTNEASGSKATGCKQCENRNLKVKHTCDKAKAFAPKSTPEKKKETTNEASGSKKRSRSPEAQIPQKQHKSDTMFSTTDKVCNYILSTIEKQESSTLKGDLLEEIAAAYFKLEDHVKDVHLVGASHNTNKDTVNKYGLTLRAKVSHGDGGHDIIVERDWHTLIKEKHVEVVDCKAYFGENRVSSKDIRSVIGALHCIKPDFNPMMATILTTSEATKCAESQITEYVKSNSNKVRVIDGKEFGVKMKAMLRNEEKGDEFRNACEAIFQKPKYKIQ